MNSLQSIQWNEFTTRPPTLIGSTRLNWFKAPRPPSAGKAWRACRLKFGHLILQIRVTVTFSVSKIIVSQCIFIDHCAVAWFACFQCCKFLHVRNHHAFPAPAGWAVPPSGTLEVTNLCVTVAISQYHFSCGASLGEAVASSPCCWCVANPCNCRCLEVWQDCFMFCFCSTVAWALRSNCCASWKWTLNYLWKPFCSCWGVQKPFPALRTAPVCRNPCFSRQDVFQKLRCCSVAWISFRRFVGWCCVHGSITLLVNYKKKPYSEWRCFEVPKDCFMFRFCSTVAWFVCFQCCKFLHVRNHHACRAPAGWAMPPPGTLEVSNLCHCRNFALSVFVRWLVGRSCRFIPWRLMCCKSM